MKTKINPYAGTELSDIYEYGFERGFNCASWVETPEIGSTLPRHVDWSGIGTIDDELAQMEAIEIMAGESEMSGRDFSPFEFQAHELNEREDSEEAWAAFEEGIADGVKAEIAKRFPNV